MNARTIALLATTATALAVPATAAADYAHVVVPGETLSSIAATDGLSISALAAANGLSPASGIEAGQVLEIPPQTAYTSAVTPAQSEYTSGGTETAASTTSGAEETSSGAGGGSYVVQPGDSLSAIAARAGTTVDQLAALNGLDPSGYLLAGSALQLPAPGSAVATTTASSSGSTEYVDSSSSPGQTTSATAATTGGPYPTPESVSGTDIADIADQSGVSPSLAQAIGWQESGWNNDEVSPTGAVGVMQIEPSTWQWIQQHLSGGTLAPDSAFDNVRGGVLLLRDLVGLTGSDSMAAAGYYQGLQSIQEHGLYPSTQQYVNDVMSLKARFGG